MPPPCVLQGLEMELDWVPWVSCMAIARQSLLLPTPSLFEMSLLTWLMSNTRQAPPVPRLSHPLFNKLSCFSAWYCVQQELFISSLSCDARPEYIRGVTGNRDAPLRVQQERLAAALQFWSSDNHDYQQACDGGRMAPRTPRTPCSISAQGARLDDMACSP